MVFRLRFWLNILMGPPLGNNAKGARTIPQRKMKNNNFDDRVICFLRRHCGERRARRSRASIFTGTARSLRCACQDGFGPCMNDEVVKNEDCHKMHRKHKSKALKNKRSFDLFVIYVAKKDFLRDHYECITFVYAHPAAWFSICP
jgi:hypothetical protein